MYRAVVYARTGAVERERPWHKAHVSFLSFPFTIINIFLDMSIFFWFIPDTSSTSCLHVVVVVVVLVVLPKL